jgi:hypothetical protein
MLKHPSNCAARVRFGTGSRKMGDDATNRVDGAAADGHDDICNQPSQAAVAVLGAPEKTILSGVQNPETALHDRSLQRLRDEKAARFAIACFLAEQ